MHTVFLITLISSLPVPVYLTSEETEHGCEVVEVAGFLKYKCRDEGGKEYYRCHNSSETYRYITVVGYSLDLCSNDPHYYRACDKRLWDFEITNDALLCGNWLCDRGGYADTRYSLKMALLVCDGRQNCADNKDEECEELTTLLSGYYEVESSKICDNACDNYFCEDEAVCNELTYGLYCKKTGNPNHYIHPSWICDNDQWCDDGEDEKDCAITQETKNTCEHKWTGEDVPVLNYTRCGVLDGSIGGLLMTQYCAYNDLRKYQSNCTDPAKVGGMCHVDGYLSNISNYVICIHPDRQYYGNRICDDIDDIDDNISIESRCLDPSKSCTNIHKHKMCDNKPDCHDESDENDVICQQLTEETCRRKIGKFNELKLPLSWIGDGVQDCMDGEDEKETFRIYCGEGRTRRLVTNNENCSNVYVCPWDAPGYVELTDLCDGIETCGNENRVCSLSRGSEDVFKTVFSIENNMAKHFSICLKGLQDIRNLSNDHCVTEHFIFPDHDYFGVDTKTELLLPNNLINCDYVYGEQYVYSSCNSKYKNSTCPLQKLTRYEACPNQYPDRVGTIANNEYLAFFTRSRNDIYTNRYFVCNDTFECVDYSKVCDLVEDCTDKSDEKNCTNHFRCNTSKALIPTTKKCDGVIDCFDASDECNEQCSKDILEGSSLKATSLIIGTLAVTANLIIMVKNIWNLNRCTTSIALVNKCLILLISLGDFLIGCYLLVISIFDIAIFKDGYCQKQIEWTTSSKCSIIGVLSTLGSQVSLFAMTGLSIVRLHGIGGSLRVPGEVNLVKSLKTLLGALIIVVTSAAIAITPIIQKFENFFVNGVKFSDELILFIGAQGKRNIFQVLEAYYGRMKDTTLSWHMTLQMVRGMFSHDNDHVDHTELVTKKDFYGNDGVCLFKYFVREDDPQKEFVWMVLIVNFACFLFISISYILIGAVSRSSSKNLVTSQNRNQIEQKNRRMNRRIFIIITTDFCCWVPFIIICSLHYFEVLDATSWYSIFSMIILPINSVINPLLYDDIISQKISAPLRFMRTSLVNSSIYQSFLARCRVAQAEEIEMEQRQGQEERSEPNEANNQDIEIAG